MDEKDGMRLRQTALEQVNANARFREVSGFLASVTSMDVAPQFIRNPDRFPRHATTAPYGSNLLERIARAPKAAAASRLRRVQDALQIAIPQLSGLKLEHDEVGIAHLRESHSHSHTSSSWQREDQFSDGTLRLIGLLWLVMGRDGTAVAGETGDIPAQIGCAPASGPFFPGIAT